MTKYCSECGIEVSNMVFSQLFCNKKSYHKFKKDNKVTILCSDCSPTKDFSYY